MIRGDMQGLPLACLSHPKSLASLGRRSNILDVIFCQRCIQSCLN